MKVSLIWVIDEQRRRSTLGLIAEILYMSMDEWHGLILLTTQRMRRSTSYTAIIMTKGLSLEIVGSKLWVEAPANDNGLRVVGGPESCAP